MDIKKEFTTVTLFSKLVAMMLVIVLPFIGFYFGVQYGQSVSATFSPEPTQELIGGNKDAYGCMIAAGYSWCAEKNKCLRPWEETCEK
jgi:hypothetical protein